MTRFVDKIDSIERIIPPEEVDKKEPVQSEYVKRAIENLK
jgi:hypothetical protein